MLRIYICPKCYNFRMVSRKPDAICFHCGTTLMNCDVKYETYINMSEEERNRLKDDFKLRMAAYNEKMNGCLQENKN